MNKRILTIEDVEQSIKDLIQSVNTLSIKLENGVFDKIANLIEKTTRHTNEKLLNLSKDISLLVNTLENYLNINNSVIEKMQTATKILEEFQLADKEKFEEELRQKYILRNKAADVLIKFTVGGIGAGSIFALISKLLS